jgi:hypothetical protein
MNRYFLFTWEEYPHTNVAAMGPSDQYRGSFPSIEAAKKAASLLLNRRNGVDNAEILTMKDDGLTLVISGFVVARKVCWELPSGEAAK